MATLFFIAFIWSALFFPFQCVRNLLLKKRENEERKKKIRGAIAKLEKKQKIYRKLGKYRPKNWAAKWIAYSNSTPLPRQRYQLNGRDLPDIPRVNEER